MLKVVIVFINCFVDSTLPLYLAEYTLCRSILLSICSVLSKISLH